MKKKLLLIEDDESFFEAIELMLADYPIEVIWADTGAKGIQIYRQNPHGFANVIVDYVLPDLRGTEVCQHLRRLNPDQGILFASGFLNVEYLTDQLETGAAGFLKKGSPTAGLRDQILRVISNYEKRTRVIGFDDYEPGKAEIELKQEGIIGRSQSMHAVLSQVKTARNSPYPTLIIGETDSERKKTCIGQLRKLQRSRKHVRGRTLRLC